MGESLDLETVREDPDGYLVAEFDSPEEALAMVEVHASRFLDHMLFEWCNKTDWWPEKRDFRTLRDWFDIELISTLVHARNVISPPLWN